MEDEMVWKWDVGTALKVKADGNRGGYRHPQLVRVVTQQEAQSERSTDSPIPLYWVEDVRTERRYLVYENMLTDVDVTEAPADLDD